MKSRIWNLTFQYYKRADYKKSSESFYKEKKSPFKRSINLNVLVIWEKHGHEDVLRGESTQSLQEGGARGQCAGRK